MAGGLLTCGFVFWPVGTGDSTTIIIDDERWMQVDLHDLSGTGSEQTTHAAIVDELVSRLPGRYGKPYLSVFALTHPDEDHCRGFADFLKRVTIGELWFTPRVFREYKKDLCDDAIAFKEEAMRRVRKLKNGGEAKAGDRLRLIGYDELLKDEEFQGFPRTRLTVPGGYVSEVDGDDLTSRFRANIHAPFKDDSAGERNETSLAMQVELKNESTSASVLLLGDLSYPTIRRIFDISTPATLNWGVMLAPHHCSKSVMYWADGDEEATLRRDILDDMEERRTAPGYIIASCEPIPASNEPGDNPPHAKARNRYQEIVEAGRFLCTQEHPDRRSPKPICFEFTDNGFGYVGPGSRSGGKSTLGAAALSILGSNCPPTQPTRYGRDG